MPDYGYLLPTRGVVQSSGSPETIAAKALSDVVGLARRAEALGLGSVWVGDSVVAKPRLEPFATLAAVATATDALSLGTAVALPNLRHAVNVAHTTATVDQLSGGRLSLGVGVGIGTDVEAEHATLGVPFDRRGRWLDELLEVVTALWKGEPVDHDGEAYSFEDASIGFSPVGEIPIYVASAAFDPSDGFPSSVEDRILAHGDGWLPIAMSPETYTAGLTHIRDRLSAVGRDPRLFDPAYYIDVVIDDDEAAAIDQARRFYDSYYPAWETLSDEEIRPRGAFGPPAIVSETLAAYEEAGVETCIVRFATREQRLQLRRFADIR